MNTGKRLDNDGDTTQMAGLQGSVLTGRALTIVLVTDNHPLDAGGLVLTAEGEGKKKSSAKPINNNNNIKKDRQLA